MELNPLICMPIKINLHPKQKLGGKKKREGEGEGERERRQNVQIFMSTLFLASSYHLASIWLMNKLGWIQSNL